MVPSKVGDDMRRRRLSMKLSQADVARSLGTSRAYVSAVEKGVPWDPDADKLVAWSRTLGWEGDYLLRRLNRTDMLTTDGTTPGVLSPELVGLIQAAVAAGVREGLQDVLRELRDEALAAADEAHRASPRVRPS